MFKVLLNIQRKCKNAIPDKHEHKSFRKQRYHTTKQWIYKAREKITSGSLCKDHPLAQQRNLSMWAYVYCT